MMEKYYIIKDGEKYYFYKIIQEAKIYVSNPVKIGEYVVYNPTEEMLLADGWTEEKQQDPPVPPVPERTLEDAKKERVADILHYDSSKEINQFFLGNTAMWLDKETRTGLRLRFESEQHLGQTVTTLWYENVPYTLYVEDALEMLFLLERYASQCYDNTQNHIANVRSLETIEAVDSYEYTTEYPEKLSFEYTV